MRHVAIVSSLLAGIVSTTLAAATCNPIAEDTDYPGNDIGTASPVATADGCCSACDALSGCKAWVWVSRNGGTCLLKSAAQSSYTYVGARASTIADPLPPALKGSCPIIEANTDYPGNDIKRTIRSTIDLCCADCENTSGCARFVYYNNNCILKTSGGTKSTFTGAQAASYYPPTVPTPAPTPAPTPLQGVCSTIEENTDYYGNDIKSTSQPSAELCCADCYAISNCKLYVWNPSGTCWLKSAQGAKSTSTGARASVVTSRMPTPLQGVCSTIEDNTDYYGNDIANTVQPSAELCCNDCYANPNCKLYVWNSATNICWLKSAQGARSTYTGARASTVISRATTVAPMVGCSAIQENTDYPGNDITSTYQTSAELCCADCTNTPDCRAFVWGPYGNGLGICYLKSLGGSPVTSNGYRAALVPPKNAATCSNIETNVDYAGNDITQTHRTLYTDCCQDCADTPDCVLYTWDNGGGGTCYLKSAKGTKSTLQGGYAGVYTRNNPVPPVGTPAPAASKAVAGTYGSYPSPTLGFASIPTAKWIPNTEDAKLDYMKPFPLPDAEQLKILHESGPKPMVEAATNTYYFPLSQSIGECAAMASTSGYKFFTYVAPTQICMVHDFSSATNLNYAVYPGQNPIPLTASIPADFQIGQSTAYKSLSACQAACLTFANCATITYVSSSTTCTFYGPLAAQTGVSAGWVVDPIVWNEVAGSMQYVTMPQRTISLTGYTTSTSSQTSIANCASAASKAGRSLFTYDTSKNCVTIAFQSKSSATLQLYNYVASPAVFSGSSLVTSGATTQVVNAGSASDCQKLCIPSVSGCYGSVYDSTATNKCTLFITAYSATVTLGWVAPNTLPQTVTSPTAVNFFVNAHQDDHELFMAAKLYDSFSNAKTKIVMIYTSAGDAGYTDGWWQAREIGTLASSQSFVKLFGFYSPIRSSTTVTVNSHVITKVTLGNSIHYFLRLPELGMQNLPTAKTSPVDRSTESYANVAALRSVVISIMKTEASGIGNAVVNSQQFLDVDHPLHAMTGQMVSDGVTADATLSKCLTQNYFWGYQHWLDSVNMVDPSLSQQRTMWLTLSQAVVKVYPAESPWYDHCVVLGRQFLASTVAGTGTC